jgi:3-oxoacyl-[acyl-carrier protein] reductase
VAVSVDVAREDDVEEMARVAISEFGRVDILVNNAGAAVVKPLVPLPELKSAFSGVIPGFDIPMTTDDWRLMIDTNLVGAILCCRAIGPHLLRQRSGRVVNIGSVWGAQATEFNAIYSAAKAGVSMLTRCLAREWGSYHINVNAVLPGYFHTSGTTFYYDNKRVSETMQRQVPLKRFGALRDAGLLVAFLASDASSYITGQTIALDGGLTC